jgi:predicted amidohydrolase YtcJ
MRNRSSLLSAAFSLLILSSCAMDRPADPAVAADLVLRDGRIVTVDELVPEAEAIAIRGDTILAVGTNAEIRQHIGESTRVIDLDGMLAIPGFIEGHGHYSGVGESNLQLDLMSLCSWD